MLKYLRASIGGKPQIGFPYVAFSIPYPHDRGAVNHPR
ncbi:hypothetical protein BDD14_0133 [Edaphobacter modestus]|uniref:Uncharacterized protein n=1 Tax=Edaphobacter modestus TaxID=388466 RepID=A0A4Q7YQ41_9BACT|nr:hypothetical protein BDD14_0133 [Edaphobacter modestus]